MIQPLAEQLTVAIATMDRPAELARCVGAVLTGAVLPARIIVVDQGCDARTPCLMAALTAGPLPITYLRQTRRGLSASRNAALRLAQTAFIAFTDDDCVPHHEWVSSVAASLCSEDALAAVTGRILPLGPERPETFNISPREATTRHDFKDRAPPWLIGSGGNMAAKTGWLFRIGGFDERLGAGSAGKAAEDMDVIYRILSAGGHIRYEPSAIIYHERQSRARRLGTRWSYGYGMGSFLGICARKRDAYTIRLLSFWIGFVLKELLIAALRQRNGFEVHQRLLSLCGTLRGFAYGAALEPAPGWLTPVASVEDRGG